jgi:gluconolactonase
VWVLDRFAEPALVLRGPRGASVTNLAYGGEGRRTLVCTDSTHGAVLFTRMDVPGTALAMGRSAAS